MDLRQLRSLVALADNGFSVTSAAQRLHVVQSAVSQQLARLEEELGIRLFLRVGKRLTGLSPEGERVLIYARRALSEVTSILDVGRDHLLETRGVLRIATTHTQACCVLPRVLTEFRRRYPEVSIEIHQGTPHQLLDLVSNGSTDFAICTEVVEIDPSLTVVRCYRWNRILVVPPRHEILNRRPLTLELLNEYPLVTYVFGFSAESRFRTSFARLGLAPRVALSAVDTEVIKTYVRAGFGVGVIADMAFDPERDGDLVARDLSHLFPWESVRLVYRRDKFLRRYQETFLELFQSAEPRTRGCLDAPAVGDKGGEA